MPETAKFVIHEQHRVPLSHRDEYLKFMRENGLPTLKRHGFRAAGPLIVAIGDSSDVTYLFAFDSLSQREKLMAEFTSHADAASYEAAIAKFTNHVASRLLMPAPFAAARPMRTCRCDQRTLTTLRTARGGRLRNRLRRSTPFGQLWLGQARRRDVAHRLAAWRCRR